MKIAVTSKGTDLEAQVDPRFGRAAHILIVNSETFDFEVQDNSENVHALKGAVGVLLTNFCGPNAFKVLEAAKVGVANDAGGTVRDAMSAYVEGKLPLSEAPNVEGQW